MEDHTGVLAQFRALGRDFSAQFPDFLVELETIRSDMDGFGLGEQNRMKLKLLAHKLAGTGASMEFTRIALTARALDVCLKDADCRTGPKENLQSLLLKIETCLDALMDALKTDRQCGKTNLETMLASEVSATPSLQEIRSSRLIYLVEDDPIQASELVSQVGCFGYAIKAFTRIQDLEAAVEHARPTAIVMDIIFPEGDLAGIETMERMGGKMADPPPVIYISVVDHVEARLQAVRSGGGAYFTKPVDAAALIDALDRLIFQPPPLPYRVLIVDDSKVHANFNALQLKKAGMKVETVNEPLKLMSPLIDFNPDLILLDMYMPECTGMELAGVIRQMEQFVSVPIVYLSAETDREKQLEAISLGADDFLTKPIEPPYLIAAVKSRIERYRKLRSLMLRDSLTGLFNHTTTKERLCQDVSRAQRQNSPLSFAMLDLDCFKSVNDTYGHAAGDRVLKSLAHLLVRRLRSTDVIGRYGGEEFAVILPNTGLEDAVILMDEIRDGFSKVHHQAGESGFSAAFSCGVASYPEFMTPQALSRAADRALYAAKSQGRNRVVSAGSLPEDDETAECTIKGGKPQEGE